MNIKMLTHDYKWLKCNRVAHTGI